MSPAKLVAEERLFDPPCLGIPAGAQAGAKVCGPGGRFVEIALLVDNGRVACAGFLADPSGACLAAASRWCELAQGRAPASCLEIDASSLAGEQDEGLAVELCLKAGRAAVTAWLDLTTSPAAQESAATRRRPGRCAPGCAARGAVSASPRQSGETLSVRARGGPGS
ncbi:hypothetical protein JCM15519_20340 [Fundidesulfovibrio butyratiphilus]